MDESLATAVNHAVGAERVGCLACGAIYSKPSSGGILLENPGCPVCGYLGWRSLAAVATGDAARRTVRRLALA